MECVAYSSGVSGKLKNISLSVLCGSAVKIADPFRVTIKPPFLRVVVDFVGFLCLYLSQDVTIVGACATLDCAQGCYGGMLLLLLGVVIAWLWYFKY